MRELFNIALVIGITWLIGDWVFPSGFNSTYLELMEATPRAIVVFLVSIVISIPMGVWKETNSKNDSSNDDVS
jgi:hypothetical protein